MVAAAVIGSAVVGGVLSSQAQGDAADTAANAQTQSSAANIAEQQRQFDYIKNLMKPFADAGLKSLGMQQDILGINGAAPQQGAYDAIENSPAFAALKTSGENAILQNASATGGLRGGNVERALSQYRPALLAQLIESQYGKLNGITSIGQNAAAGTGNAASVTSTNIGTSLDNIGAAQAGAALARGRATGGLASSLGGGVGLYSALGGFGNTGGAGAPYGTGGAGDSVLGGAGYDPYNGLYGA